jgi:hypothetical protein
MSGGCGEQTWQHASATARAFWKAHLTDVSQLSALGMSGCQVRASWAASFGGTAREQPPTCLALSRRIPSLPAPANEQ